MLKINLLPQEYKTAERTSFGMLLLLMLCTLLSVGSICFAAYLYLGVLNSAESRRNIAQEEFENLSPMAKYADDLLAEKREYMKRSEAIAQIENTRILWTKKIDQLCYVINNEGDTARNVRTAEFLKPEKRSEGLGQVSMEKIPDRNGGLYRVVRSWKRRAFFLDLSILSESPGRRGFPSNPDHYREGQG